MIYFIKEVNCAVILIKIQFQKVMKTAEEQAYIASGILELYVAGLTSEEETQQVELVAASSPVIQKEIAAIETVIESWAASQAVAPDPGVKAFVMATVEYTERLKGGELPADPPHLHAGATITDYAAWLDREDMHYTGNEPIYAKIIGYTPQAISAIVWLKEKATAETHHDQYERFLIVEGSCDITVGERIYQLQPGDYFEIPLHQDHHVQVTSAIPCKIILQRVAA